MEVTESLLLHCRSSTVVTVRLDELATGRKISSHLLLFCLSIQAIQVLLRFHRIESGLVQARVPPPNLLGIPDELHVNLIFTELFVWSGIVRPRICTLEQRRPFVSFDATPNGKSGACCGRRSILVFRKNRLGPSSQSVQHLPVSRNLKTAGSNKPNS